jgi:hypothetical protein
MQPRTLVLRGNTRQPVGGFKGELLHKLDNHRESILALRSNDSQTDAAHRVIAAGSFAWSCGIFPAKGDRQLQILAAILLAWI